MIIECNIEDFFDYVDPSDEDRTYVYQFDIDENDVTPEQVKEMIEDDCMYSFMEGVEVNLVLKGPPKHINGKTWQCTMILVEGFC